MYLLKFYGSVLDGKSEKDIVIDVSVRRVDISRKNEIKAGNASELRSPAKGVVVPSKGFSEKTTISSPANKEIIGWMQK